MADNCAMKESTRRKLRVLELYSGIGGMHYALKESGLEFEVVAAADINNIANDIYRHNFPTTKLLQRVIESIGLLEFDKLSPDMITMSPPCQPFTRVGLQKDKDDQRTKSFFHLLDLLPQLSKRPYYILLENVKGFDLSETREDLLKTLEGCGYQIQEFLVTPNQFGVPNSRLRYYLLAKQKGLKFNFPIVHGVRTDIPDCMSPYMVHKVQSCLHPLVRQSGDTTAPNRPGSSETSDCLAGDVTCDQPFPRTAEADTRALREGCDQSFSRTAEADAKALRDEHCHSKVASREQYQGISRPISHYLENKPGDYFKCFLLDEKWFKRFWCMDIVQDTAKNCCCFTKGYGHHIEGAGSILQMAPQSSVDLNIYKDKRASDETTHDAVRALRLRFFTPREVANIMCFPSDFSFVDQLSVRQCYRVLGNSLNVHVVAILMRLMCKGDDILQMEY